MGNTYGKLAKIVTSEIRDCLNSIETDKVDIFVEKLLAADNVFFIGVGRVKISLEAAIKRFTHLGISCFMVGDLAEPPITEKDVLIVASGSGESIIPYEITKKAKSFFPYIVTLTTNDKGKIAQLADLTLKFVAANKVNKFESIQPMSTVFEQNLYIFNDIISLMIMERQELSNEDLKLKHANLE